ncbi:MAG TPA: TonB-dependent receptor, partial [Cyclobacteriaceae bacterium]
LGQTDFSLFPGFLLEDVNLQLGTASSLYGSDALGGSVLINQRKPEFKPGMSLLLHQQAGSFGRYFSGIKFQFSNARWDVRTKLMDRWLQNNFSYNSPAVGHSKKQNNAAVHTYGFDQQLHYKISDNKKLSFETLYTYNHRQIQPTVTNNTDTTTLEDKNARFSLSYDGEHAVGHVYTSIGYLYNDQVYNVTSLTHTEQRTAIINIDKPIGETTSIRYGANASFYKVHSDGIEQKKNESRYDLFASVNQYILRDWSITLNLRQAFYAGHHAPFSPSLGTQYQMIATSKQRLILRAQASRGYRVPTLNDRYWNPGGNPNLKSEDAHHIEGGATWTVTKSKHHIKTELTGYKTLVDNWIMWKPIQGVWSPINLQKVNAYGTEVSVRDEFQITGKFMLTGGVNYSYNRSKNLKATSATAQNTIGKQLPYVPYHLVNAYIRVSHTRWVGEINSNYTSMRYTSLDNDSYQGLEAYAIANAYLTYSINFSKAVITTRGEVNNILNSYYENMQKLAMPGRNYNLNLTIQFKNKTSE